MQSDTNLMTLLGTALFMAQKNEFSLLGIAAHCMHLDEFKKNRHLKNITRDAVLSAETGSREKRRVTLNQLYKLIGPKIVLSNSFLDKYMEDRNLLAHEFWRAVRPMRGKQDIANPEEFLLDFIQRSEVISSALLGAISTMAEQNAKYHNAESKYQESSLSKIDRSAYIALAGISLNENENG